MAAISGHFGRIKINANVLRAHRWSVNDRVEDFDVTTFENNGIGSYIPGLQDADISFDAYWDPADNPFQAPILLAPGSFAGSFQLFVTKLSNTQVYTFTNVLFISVQMETATRMATHYSVTGKASFNSYVQPTS